MTTAEALSRLRDLIASDASARHLRADSASTDDVEALQQLLHVLGYDRQLNWEHYGADGDYGGGTALAVSDLAASFDMDLDGTRVPVSLAIRLVDAVAPLVRATDTSSPDAVQPSDPVLELARDSVGPAIVDLQLRLAGFRGTAWDGDFGPGTELQVMAFQRAYMRVADPSGAADADTQAALDHFAAEYPVDFDSLACPCGECEGFGRGQFAGEYRDGQPHIEAYHRREYPGIHKAILHAYRAACFYLARAGLGEATITSGYRCWVNNEQHDRTSTNHMGKAIDFDLPREAGDDDDDHQRRCDRARAVLVDACGFQIGWSGINLKALEPSDIAPTWVHTDVRCYQPRYLDESFFVRSADGLDEVVSPF